MAGLREYFWSQRLLQWLPLAGASPSRDARALALLARRLDGLVRRRPRVAACARVRAARLLPRACCPPCRPTSLLVAAIPLLVPTLLRGSRLGSEAGLRFAGYRLAADVLLACSRRSSLALVATGRLRPAAAVCAPRCSGDPLLEQREPLGEDHVLVGELRDHGRVVQQHREDEERRDGEEHGRRVAGDADPAGDRVQAAAPRREHEQHERRSRARAARSARAAAGCGSARGRRG